MPDVEHNLPGANEFRYDRAIRRCARHTVRMEKPAASSVVTEQRLPAGAADLTWFVPTKAVGRFRGGVSLSVSAGALTRIARDAAPLASRPHYARTAPYLKTLAYSRFCIVLTATPARRTGAVRLLKRDLNKKKAGGHRRGGAGETR